MLDIVERHSAAFVTMTRQVIAAMYKPFKAMI